MTCSAAAMIERLTSRKHPETLSTGARKSESFLGNLGQRGQGGSALGGGGYGEEGGVENATKFTLRQQVGPRALARSQAVKALITSWTAGCPMLRA